VLNGGRVIREKRWWQTWHTSVIVGVGKWWASVTELGGWLRNANFVVTSFCLSLLMFDLFLCNLHAEIIWVMFLH
jgi:hypothetical protein